ncbi:PREDICTED: V-type proton ATPase subunit G 3 [Miniopterus natalensis]|uniref:V-type proton ATPase subunit G 3 n=1 Tax=Miniopterus natalensis TaxID=291302 RepID=UPI0007A6EDD5|nr:PREDICTED: V-type proton ATPase subunit G 3 [Miniopterus natalensis]
MVEIDQYRLQRDREFRTKQAKVMGSQSNLSEEIDGQTLEAIKDMRGGYHQRVEGVLAQVLNMVCDVKPEIHANYRAAR